MVGVGAVSGYVYGVILNDAEEYVRLEAAFGRDPYKRPPVAPVLYIKPRNTLSDSPSDVPYPARTPLLEANLTLALLFRSSARRVSRDRALDCVGSAALAIDISTPTRDYFRPAVRERSADRSLVLGAFGAVPADIAAVTLQTTVDGVVKHKRSLSMLRRDAAQLIADITEFMSFDPGDVLLVGLTGDAPTVAPGATIFGSAAGFAPVHARLVPEEAP